MHSPLTGDFKYYAVAVALIAVCFGFWLVRPYSVLSDTGYQALSARQYVDHYNAVFNTVRLVNPRDLSKDVISPLTAWSPSWTALFAVAFKAGLSVGMAGRLIALFLSLMGTLGWVRMSSLVGLKGRWRMAGIVCAALYCLRTGTMSKTGAGDQIIFAVAPWLLMAALPLAVPLSGAMRKIVVGTILLSIALGAVYWLKYSGIFLSIAILCAVVLEQVRGFQWKRAAPFAGALLLYAIAFLAPVLGLKAWNYSISGSDFVETSAHFSPPRTAARMGELLAETAFGASTILFAAQPGAAQLGPTPPMNYPNARAWLVRTPGLILLATFLFLMARRPRGYIRNVTILAAVVPLVGFPALSFVAGLRFSYALGRCCEPYWILFELLIFVLLAENATEIGIPRPARLALAATAVSQILLFLWIPVMWGRLFWVVVHSPHYETGAAELWNTDLSKYGTRDIDERVKSLIHSPSDVVVPAVYSDRAFGTDTMLEFGGRLLPLATFFVPLAQTHGKDGANYYSTAPLVSSAPVRIILVAPDPYNRPDFMQQTERVMRRFTQVRQWKPGPVDPHGRVWIWVGETA
ncbi:MAG: hypothetical protein ABJC09_02215 [Terriglobia bacterium]